MAKHHIHITVEGLTPDQAAELANEIAEVLMSNSATDDGSIHIRGNPYVGTRLLNKVAATFPPLSADWWSSRKATCKPTVHA